MDKDNENIIKYVRQETDKSINMVINLADEVGNLDDADLGALNKISDTLATATADTIMTYADGFIMALYQENKGAYTDFSEEVSRAVLKKIISQTFDRLTNFDMYYKKEDFDIK